MVGARRLTAFSVLAFKTMALVPYVPSVWSPCNMDVLLSCIFGRC
jgi:hypothetical protein